MNVWRQIDALLKRHKAELARATAEVRALKGGVVRVDDFGRWRCSWRPPRGADRTTQRITARSGAELVEKLKAAIAALPPPAPRKKGG